MRDPRLNGTYRCLPRPLLRGEACSELPQFRGRYESAAASRTLRGLRELDGNRLVRALRTQRKVTGPALRLDHPSRDLPVEPAPLSRIERRDHRLCQQRMREPPHAIAQADDRPLLSHARGSHQTRQSRRARALPTRAGSRAGGHPIDRSRAHGAIPRRPERRSIDSHAQARARRTGSLQPPREGAETRQAARPHQAARPAIGEGRSASSVPARASSAGDATAARSPSERPRARAWTRSGATRTQSAAALAASIHCTSSIASATGPSTSSMSRTLRTATPTT